MKNTDIGFEKFEEDFIADLNTMYIKPKNSQGDKSMNELITRIETMNPKPSEAIVLFFNTKECDINMTAEMFNQLQEKFPDNAVIALPDTMSLKTFETGVLMGFLDNAIKALPKAEVYKQEVNSV